MKNIAKFYIFITAFLLTLPCNSLAQNDEKQMIKDAKKIIYQDVKDDEKTDKINGNFYFGVDAIFQNSTIRGKGAENPYNYYEPETSTIGVFAGYDNRDFYKIESYYSKLNEKKQTIGSNSSANFELRTRTLGVDFKPYLVFDKESQGLAYLIFGLNYNQIDLSENTQTQTVGIFGIKNKITARDSHTNRISPVFGLGVEYLFYKNFALRFQFKRNFVNAKIVNSEFVDKIKVVETLGIGISHQF